MTGLCGGAGDEHADGDDGPYGGIQRCVHRTGHLQRLRRELPGRVAAWCGGSGRDHRGVQVVQGNLPD